MKIELFQRQNHKNNYEIHRIPYWNYENHKNLIILRQNHENHLNVRIPVQNHESHENKTIPNHH